MKPPPQFTNLNQAPTGLCLQWYLMASYLYYIKDISLLEDATYDQLAKRLLAEFDTFEHQHKYLINKADLEAGTLFSLLEIDYPKMIQSSATLAYNKFHCT